MIFTETGSATTPINLVIGSFGILNVNKEGTGSSILCPSSRSHLKPSGRGLPPVAMTTLSTSLVSPFLKPRIKPFLLSFKVLMADFVLIPIPKSCTSFIRQFMIVSEESVVGNIRPSDSTFNSTPRSLNQEIVSVGENIPNAFLSDFSPRG